MLPPTARRYQGARRSSTSSAAVADAIPVRALRGVLVTDGPHSAQLVRWGRCIAQAIPPQVTTVDVTGAGDTVAGTFLAARAAGLNDTAALSGQCVRPARTRPCLLSGWIRSAAPLSE
ncbi:MAG: PfkB family carbohydrate kinase [Pseudonocardiaceae bacterium]